MKPQATDDFIPLDGNAIAGMLSSLFAVEVTTAILTCNNCGASAEVGTIHVYGGAMGAILRCTHCDTAVLRFVQTPRGSVLDMRGTRSFVVSTGSPR
jgi:hypothetical protein